MSNPMEKQIKTIEKQIKDAEINNYLDFSDMQLKELPIIPSHLNNIVYLFLNDNKLTNINISNFSDLKVFDIGRIIH